MSDHQMILKMIEEVSPDDTAKLDEIDARVWCYTNEEAIRPFVGGDFQYRKEGDWYFLNSFPEYTRSRDALKAIRPEGWVFEIECRSSFFDNWDCCGCDWVNEGKTFIAARCKTEELAELHAIIQAISFERQGA